MKVKFLVAISLIFFKNWSVFSQANLDGNQYSLPNTEIHFLNSKCNGVQYKLYISKPLDYSTDKQYPVLYLLDADYSFAIAKNIVDHLTERNHLDEIILVGIAYAGPPNYRINRTRDYTPINSEESAVSFQSIQKKYSGGGKGFLDFIENELIPYIDRSFPTTEFRAISGHSYGGLFSSWALLTRPSIFDGYIIVSPSLWYNDHFLFGIPNKLKSIKNTKKIYLNVGEREVNQHWNMPTDLSRFHSFLNGIDNEHLEIQKDLGENETHNSIFPTAVSNGIRFVFDGY